jgi:hypothetical protein
MKLGNIEVGTRQLILTALLIGMIVNLYAISGPSVSESKSYASTFGISITIITAIVYILLAPKTTDDENPTASYITVGIIAFFILFGFVSSIFTTYIKKSAIFQTATDKLGSSVVVNTIEATLLLGIVVFGLTILNNKLQLYAYNNTGPLAFLLAFLFYVPCLVQDAIDYMRTELQMTTPATFILLAAEFVLVAAYMIVPKLLEKQLLTNGTPILNDPVFLNTATNKVVQHGHGDYGLKRANNAFSLWTFVNPQRRDGYGVNVFSYGSYPNIKYIRGSPVEGIQTQTMPLIEVKVNKEFITSDIYKLKFDKDKQITVKRQKISTMDEDNKIKLDDDRDAKWQDIKHRYKVEYMKDYDAELIDKCMHSQINMFNYFTKTTNKNGKITYRNDTKKQISSFKCPFANITDDDILITLPNNENKSQAYDLSANVPFMLVDVIANGITTTVPIGYGRDLPITDGITEFNKEAKVSNTLFKISNNQIVLSKKSSIEIVKQEGQYVNAGEVVLRLNVLLTTCETTDINENLKDNYALLDIVAPASGKIVNMVPKLDIADSINTDDKLFDIEPVAGDTYRIAVGPNAAYDITMPTQKWNNIVLNYNTNATIDVFANGHLVRTFTDTSEIERNTELNRLPTDVRIGSNNGLYGAICNINYYKTPLSKSQITTQYNLLAERNPPINNIM